MFQSLNGYSLNKRGRNGATSPLLPLQFPTVSNLQQQPVSFCEHGAQPFLPTGEQMDTQTFRPSQTALHLQIQQELVQQNLLLCLAFIPSMCCSYFSAVANVAVHLNQFAEEFATLNELLTCFKKPRRMSSRACSVQFMV